MSLPSSLSSSGSQPQTPVANLAGKFRPIAELGRGGMATVYLVVAQGMGGFNKLQVAKTLHEQLASDSEFVHMFLEEARLVARLNHPNVVQTYDVGFDGQSYCILMEYLDGQSLENIVRRGDKLVKNGQADGRMPLALHLRVVSDMLAGLNYAHDLADFDGKPLNIVHRDVSPHNVLVTYDGHVKLVDFGIAKAADSNGQTRAGVIKGKVAYMAPEQFGGTSIDRRADIFAAGIVLWQAITGERMWKGLSEADIFKKLAGGQVPLARSINPTVHEELERICARALACNREERYQTAAEFQHELDEYIAKHERATSQQVGQWVAKTFADARTRIKSVIEQQLKAKPNPHVSLPAATTDLGSSASREIPLIALPRESMAEIGGPTSASSGAVAQGSRAGSWKLVAGSCVVLALAVGSMVWARSRTPGAGSTGASSGDAPVAGDQVVLSVTVTPPEAAVFLDDVPIPDHTAKRVKDGASHRVRAEAPGYRTAGELVVFDSTMVQLEIVLEKEGRPTDDKKKPGTSSGTAPNVPVWVPPSTTTHPATSATPSASAKSTGTTAPTTSARTGTPSTASPSGNIIDTREDPWRK